jgi:hypothetical protein
VQLSQWMNEAGFSCHVKGDRVRIEFDQDYEHTFAGLDREARRFSENNLCFELLQAVADRGEVELPCDLQPLAIEFDEQLLGDATLERLEDVLHCRGEEENDLVQHARGLTSVDAVKRHPLARIDRLLRGLVRRFAR